jgi:hypothetical protein
VPPSAFDLIAPPYHVTVLFAYASPNPTNAALAATLPRFTSSPSDAYSTRAASPASTTHHQAADKYSMSTFFHTWADVVRAKNGAPPPQTMNLPMLPLYSSYRPGVVVPRAAGIGFTAERQVSRTPRTLSFPCSNT